MRIQDMIMNNMTLSENGHIGLPYYLYPRDPNRTSLPGTLMIIQGISFLCPSSVSPKCRPQSPERRNSMTRASSSHSRRALHEIHRCSV